MAKAFWITGLSAIGLGLSSSPAVAQPAYMRCEFSSGAPVEITIDESVGTVVLFMPHSGYTRTIRAVFRPDRVIFSIPDIAYEISRVDMTATRVLSFSRRPESGKCDLLRAPKRAF